MNLIRYKLTELKLPIIELNPNIPDNALDFKISLKNVKLPEVTFLLYVLTKGTI